LVGVGLESGTARKRPELASLHAMLDVRREKLEELELARE
jgi:hypothetical protein